MTKQKVVSMPEALEAEAWALLHQWENSENDFINPMDYIYYHASDKLKAYYDEA